MAGEGALRGVVVGLGTMGSFHFRVLSTLRDTVVAAVVDPDVERREAATRMHPGLAAYESFDEALDRAAVDFACVAAPIAELAPLAHVAIAAGVPVLVEKPMAATEEQALGLVQAAERAAVPLTVGHVERFNPAVAALKKRLDAEAVGEIFQIYARRLSPFPARHASHSVAFDLATHDLDIVRYLTGDEIGRVFAEIATRTQTDGEDLVCSSLRLDGGTTALLEVNWLTPTKLRELTVTGEKGMFVVNYLTQELAFFENPHATSEWDTLSLVRGPGEGDMTRYALERREPLVVQWETFTDALRAGTPPPVTGWDGLAVVSAARAIQESGRTHQPVVPSYRTLFREAASIPLGEPG